MWGRPGGNDVLDIGLVIPAAGRGERLGIDVPKAVLELGGVPMVVRTLRLFEPFGLLGRTVVVAPPDFTEAVQTAVSSRFPDCAGIDVIRGGAHRQESVFEGLRALPNDTQLVVIHDCARPFTAPEIIKRCIEDARKHGAAIAAVPTVDTIVGVGAAGTVAGTYSRSELWAVQTPQVFDYQLILEAHERAHEEGFLATDDAALVTRRGHDVRVVTGDYDNIKVTVPRDLELAGQIIRRQ